MEPQFAGYRVTSCIRDVAAAGDRPELWRAVREVDGAEVVLKVFRTEAAERARREADLAATVDHRHLLAVLAVESSESGVALVLPWQAGGSLADLLAHRRRLRWTETLTVLIPVADALAAAHERGLVHADVSAANILFDQEGRPVLADLGSSRAATEAGGGVAATPSDVAPEVARGGPPTEAADLFSLGSVAKQCLTGASAWPAESFQDVVIQSAAGQWPDVDELTAPAALLAIVRRLLDPEPDDRGSAAANAVDLRKVGQPEPVALVERCGDDGVVGPPPATVVRPDAVNPPVASIPVRRSRWNRWGWRASAAGRARPRVPWVRLAVASVVVVAVAFAAVRVGWWWAGAGRSHPVSMAAATHEDGPGGAATDDVAAPGPARTAPRPSSQSESAASQSASAALQSASAAAAPGPSAAAQSAAAPDWATVVADLDDARTVALRLRNPALLADVYVAGSPAWSADASLIATMIKAGYRVADARHRVESVEPLGSADAADPADIEIGDVVRLRVVESLPSYEILDDSGTVIGRTTMQAADTVTMEVTTTDDGFRIARIAAG